MQKKTFREYSGHYQKIKYDSKKQDYFVTYKKQKFYFNNCFVASLDSEDKNLICTWQEGKSVFLLLSKEDRKNFSDSSFCKIVYCPPVALK